MNKQELWKWVEREYEEQWGSVLHDLGRDTFLDPDLNIIAYIIEDLHEAGIDWQSMTADELDTALYHDAYGLIDVIHAYIAPTERLTHYV